MSSKIHFDPRDPRSDIQKQFRKDRRIKAKTRLLNSTPPRIKAFPGADISIQLSPSQPSFKKDFTVSGTVTVFAFPIPGTEVSLLMNGEVVQRGKTDLLGNYDLRSTIGQFGKFTFQTHAAVTILEAVSDIIEIEILPKVILKFDPRSPSVGDSVQGSISITDGTGIPVSIPYEIDIIDPDNLEAKQLGVTDRNGHDTFAFNAIKSGIWRFITKVDLAVQEFRLDVAEEERVTPKVSISFSPSNPVFGDNVRATIVISDLDTGGPLAGMNYAYEVFDPDNNLTINGVGQTDASGTDDFTFQVPRSGTWNVRIIVLGTEFVRSLFVSSAPPVDGPPPPPPPPPPSPVEPPPPTTDPLEVSSFTAQPMQGEIPFNVKFNIAVLGGVPPFAYAISYGDGRSDLKENISARSTDFIHPYEKQGIHKASATIIDASGSARSTQEIFIQAEAAGIAGPPQDGDVRIKVLSLVGGAGSFQADVEYINTRKDIAIDGFRYLSVFRDGENIGWDKKAILIPESSVVGITYKAQNLPPGTYTLFFNHSDKELEAWAAQVEVSVTIAGPPPTTVPLGTLNFSGQPPLEGEAPLYITFTMGVDTGISPYTFVISFGDGKSDIKHDEEGVLVGFVHVYEKPGIYKASATVTDGGGRTSSSREEIIQAK